MTINLTFFLNQYDTKTTYFLSSSPSHTFPYHFPWAFHCSCAQENSFSSPPFQSSVFQSGDVPKQEIVQIRLYSKQKTL